jgi:hypothetical protein
VSNLTQDDFVVYEDDFGVSHDHSMAKMDRFCRMQPRELTAILPAGHARKLRETRKWRRIQNAHAVAKDSVRLHYEEAGSGTPIIFLQVRGRPHQLGAADALLLARPPLHRLFGARLYAI